MAYDKMMAQINMFQRLAQVRCMAKNIMATIDTTINTFPNWVIITGHSQIYKGVFDKNINKKFSFYIINHQ